MIAEQIGNVKQVYSGKSLGKLKIDEKFNKNIPYDIQTECTKNKKIKKKHL